MQIHELNTFAGTPGDNNFLAIDNGSDTGKISGTSLLAPVNDRVDNIVASVTPDSAVVLLDMPYGINPGANTLSQSVANFDYLEFYFGAAGDMKTIGGYIRVPVDQGGVEINIPAKSGVILYDQQIKLTWSGTTLNQTAYNLWEWDGEASVGATSQTSVWVTQVIRVVGIKTSSTTNAELADARVGANGITYSTAGGAIRGQYLTNKGLIEALMSVDFGINESPVISGYSDSNAMQTAMANSPFVFDQDVSGYLIKGVKLKIVTPGKLSIGYITPRPGGGDPFDPNDVVVTNEITTTGTGIQIIDLPNPFVVPPGNALFIGVSTDTIRWAYGANGESGFLYIVNNSSYAQSQNSIGVDIIASPVNDYSTIYAGYPHVSRVADMVETDFYDPASFYDGYNSNNHSTSGPGTAPFMVIPNTFGRVFSITLKIFLTGTLSIGTIKASDVVSPFDFTKVNVHEVITFNQAGEQTYYLNTPMDVESDDYIVLCARTDTAGFYYGPSGVDTKFYYVSGTTVVRSDNSLGVSFNGLKQSFNPSADSVYKNKKLSILGDSISTFSGYIPAGNATYYPSGTVQNVSDTWWYKLYTALGMVLDTNNSWSGSRVTTTGGSQSAGCGDRCEALGSPDVIIVWMGINDFNNEVALGTYDGASDIPSDTTKFREAYGIMLNKILTKYQTAEVWVCTLPQCERNSPTGFPEVNQNGVALVEFNKAILELATAFGVKVLDHNKCGLTYQNMPTYNPDNLHPNKLGHSLVANNDIRQMDNFVRTRY